MRSDDLEFLISQYADGTLDPHRVPEVEAVLRRDQAARDLLASYQTLDGALDAAARDAGPTAVRWDELQVRISRQVALLAAGPSSVGASEAAVAADAPLPEEVEAQLAGYADGSLTAAEARLVEARLAADPHARLVVAAYTSLERAFDAARADRPAVRWEALGDHLAAAVDEATGRAAVPAAAAPRQVAGSYKPNAYRPTAAAAPAAKADRFVALRQAEPARAGVAGRIGRWAAAPRRLAIAACLLVAGSVSFQLVKGVGRSPSGGAAANPGQGLVAPAPGEPGSSVAGKATPPSDVVPLPGVTPGVADPAAPSIANVQVGPPPDGVDRAALSEGYGDTTADARVSRSSLVAKDKAASRDHARKDPSDTAAAFPR